VYIIVYGFCYYSSLVHNYSTDGQLRIPFRFAAEAGNYFLFYITLTSSGAHSAPIQRLLRALSPQVMWPERVNDHTHASSAEIKIVHLHLHFLYHFMAW